MVLANVLHRSLHSRSKVYTSYVIAYRIQVGPLGLAQWHYKSSYIYPKKGGQDTYPAPHSRFHLTLQYNSGNQPYVSIVWVIRIQLSV